MNQFLAILNNLLLQIFLFIVAIGAVGYLISIINRVFYSLTGNSKAVCYATGIIGTPIHECSHALMCLIFFHKIEEISLFRIGDDGVLGYVNHSYNNRNIYQRVGNYFIGIAPIIFGGVVLFLGMRFLTPVIYTEFSEYINDFVKLQKNGFGFEWFAYVFVVFRGMFVAIINGIGTGYWYIFLVLMLCVALHMNVSSADIRGSLSALPIVIAVMAVVNFALGFIAKGAYDGFIGFTSILGGYVVGMLLVALVFSAFSLIIALLVRVIITGVSALPHRR